MNVDDVAVATARATYYVCVRAHKSFLWRREKSLQSAFKMPSVGLVETETFFCVA